MSIDEDASKARQLNDLLDAAFCNIEELHKRLNTALLTLPEATLFFTNSCARNSLRSPSSLAPGLHLLPEAHVVYSAGQTVGKEIKQFEQTDMQVVGFATDQGPAQAAGVRAGWVLDVTKTK